jgi:hypothetical protein
VRLSPGVCHDRFIGKVQRVAIEQDLKKFATVGDRDDFVERGIDGICQRARTEEFFGSRNLFKVDLNGCLPACFGRGFDSKLCH